MDLNEDGFPQLYKLCCLISTIPASSASVERPFSMLKRVNTYTRNTQKEDHISNLAFISIEKESLKHLQKEVKFLQQGDRKVFKTRRKD